MHERRAPESYATPYIAQTRERDELFVHGFGARADKEGGSVAKVDTATLEEEWRTEIIDEEPSTRLWPGVVTARGDGSLYAVFASRLVRLNAATGAVLAEADLPHGRYGAVYDGMTRLSDGRIVVKAMMQVPCPPRWLLQRLPGDVAEDATQVALLGGSRVRS